MKTRYCVICGRPLPQRRWWQLTWLILPPPPLCRPDDPECMRLFSERMRQDNATDD